MLKLNCIYCIRDLWFYVYGGNSLFWSYRDWKLHWCQNHLQIYWLFLKIFIGFEATVMTTQLFIQYAWKVSLKEFYEDLLEMSYQLLMQRNSHKKIFTTLWLILVFFYSFSSFDNFSHRIHWPQNSIHPLLIK